MALFLSIVALSLTNPALALRVSEPKEDSKREGGLEEALLGPAPAGLEEGERKRAGGLFLTQVVGSGTVIDFLDEQGKIQNRAMIRVIGIRWSTARLSFEAPPAVLIHRNEIWESILRNQVEPLGGEESPAGREYLRNGVRTVDGMGWLVLTRNENEGVTLFDTKSGSKVVVYFEIDRGEPKLRFIAPRHRVQVYREERLGQSPPQSPSPAGLEEKTVDRAALEKMPIAELGLQATATQRLEVNGITTVGDLLKLSEWNLADIFGAHEDSLILIATRWDLLRHGIALQNGILPSRSGPLLFDKGILKNVPIRGEMYDRLKRVPFVGLRSRKMIARTDTQMVGELLGRSASELLEGKNFGPKSLEAARQTLIRLVLELQSKQATYNLIQGIADNRYYDLALMTEAEAVERFRVEPDPGGAMQNVGYLLEGEGSAFATPLALLEAGKILTVYSFASVVENRQDRERLMAIVATNADARKLIEERLIVVEEQDGEDLAAQRERARELARRLLLGTEIRTVSTFERNLLDQLNRLLAAYGFRVPKDPFLHLAARILLEAA